MLEFRCGWVGVVSVLQAASASGSCLVCIVVSCLVCIVVDVLCVLL